MSPQATRRLLAIHRWCGLIVSLNVLLFAVTGALLIFHEEIDEMLGVVPKLAASGEQITLARAIEIARAHKPAENALYVFADPEEYPGAIMVGMAKDSHDLAKSKPVLIDAARGSVLEKVNLEDSFSHVIWRLHAQLFMGPPGALLVGLIGLCFLTSLISGVILYGPLMRRFTFGMLRRERKLRTLLADLHKLLGAATFGWNLVVVATGVFLSLGSTLLQVYTMTELAALGAPYAREPVVSDLSTIDQAVVNAEAASHGRRWSMVALPGSSFASPRHYAVLLKGREGLDQRMLTMGLVDAKTPAEVDHREFPWYLRALLVSEPLHFGDYGGMPLKLLWLVFTLITVALTATGVWITFSTQRDRAERKRSEALDDLTPEAAE